MYNPDGFVSVNNMVKEHHEIKKRNQIPNMLWNILCKNNGNRMCQL